MKVELLASFEVFRCRELNGTHLLSGLATPMLVQAQLPSMSLRPSITGENLNGLKISMDTLIMQDKMVESEELSSALKAQDRGEDDSISFIAILHVYLY